MKQVWMCEGCGEIYNNDVVAQQCEESHDKTIKDDATIIGFRFKPRSAIIEAVLIEYKRTCLIHPDGKEIAKVWFHCNKELL